MNEFLWLRPWWLLALLPAAMLLWLCWQKSPSGSAWQKILPPHLAARLLVGERGGQRRWSLVGLGLAWLLAVLALAGPSWQQTPLPLYELKGGRVLVMDMSLSMRATDWQPDRLTQARFKAIDLLRGIREGETGLVAYAGDAFVIAPLTKDNNTLEHLVRSLSPEIMPAQGSRADLGIAQAKALLSGAGYQSGDIILFTDGLSDREREAIHALELGNYRLLALAFGTPEGAPVRKLSGELLKDADGQVVLPKLALEQLCPVVTGPCIRAGSDDLDLGLLLQPPTEDGEESIERRLMPDDGGRYLLWLLLPLCWLAFRRGLMVVALVLVLPLPSPAATLWQNDNQQAHGQYQLGRYEQAAGAFADARWQAAALYRAEQYRAAAEIWAQFDEADGHYNRGNALALAGELEAAKAAYQAALGLQPDHEDAEYNLRLLEQQQQQQNQGAQQEQQQSQSDQDSQAEPQPDTPDNKIPEDGEQTEQPQSQSQRPEQGQQPEQQPQGADNQGDDRASRQGGREAEGGGDDQPLALSTEAVLDAVNDDPGHLLQEKMRRAYEARQQRQTEEEQW
ncbi:VWA domain-containing protein [Gallaecimonas sp. GXIMD4217]|uniref:VWA domain-containing protein n=1 Tax=Gallaecimonas sp. GXIMD4217 TaxID=3131927 RepID=UPI00311B40CA